eukprot:5072702-Pyramimonas_sp.AAC.1
MVPKESMKSSFYLVPAQGMQTISQGKLSAPRILRAQKVKRSPLTGDVQQSLPASPISYTNK